MSDLAEPTHRLNGTKTMNAVSKTEDKTPTNVGALDMINVIERMLMNPDLDMDRVERMMALRERVEAKAAEVAFNEALAAMGPELPIVEERGEIRNSAGKVQSTYALWEDLNEAIKPVMARHGFALRFRTSIIDGKPAVTGILSHAAGHSDETTIVLPIDGSGSKNSVQAIGSSTSYGQRYTAKLLLNLTSRGADDDGRGAGISEAAQRAISEINLAEGLEGLRKWKAECYDGLSKILSPDDLREVVALYNRRSKGLRAAQQPASDFPGDR